MYGGDGGVGQGTRAHKTAGNRNRPAPPSGRLGRRVGRRGVT